MAVEVATQARILMVMTTATNMGTMAKSSKSLPKKPHLSKRMMYLSLQRGRCQNFSGSKRQRMR